MRARRLWMLLLMACCVSLCHAAEDALTAGPFAVQCRKELHVTYRGQVLIAEDSLTPLASLEEAESLRVDRRPGVAALNILHENNPAFRFRKEVAVHENGVIELTVKTEYASYQSDFPRVYAFKIPLQTLVGASYTLREGSHNWNWDTRGTITPDLPQGNLIKNWATRFAAFEKEGLRIVLDGNPLGPRQTADYPIGGEPMACWSVSRSGDFIVFTTLQRPARSAGGVFGAKMVIYEGAYDYAQKHPLEFCSCYAAGKTNRPAAHFAFGTARFAEGMVTKAVDRIPASPVIPADAQPYAEQRGWGWTDVRGLRLVKRHRTNVFANGLFAPRGGDRAFCVDLRPAYYVVTVHTGHPSQDLGPFTVSVNGEVVAQDVTVAAGATKALFGAYYLRDPEKQVRVEFSGAAPWAVNTIALQAVIYPNEDFVFARKLWVVDGLYEPDIRPDTGYTAASPPWTPKPVNPEELAWRWSMRMTDWAHGNAATGFEFNTPELCDRRARELKAAGYNTVNYTAFFWHLAYTHLHAEIVAQTKMVVDACHRHGLKVIYHIDVPIIIYGGTGLQYMIRHADWGTRDIRYNLSALQKVCWNNPDFRTEFFTRVTDLVRTTGLDGGMFDEVYFDEAEYCGCAHCREAFTQATGLTLPRDPASPVFLNPDNALWMQWLEWRRQSYGDWFKALRDALKDANPNFCILVYGNESDLIHGWRHAAKGYSMLHAARWAQFVGTEIDLRNPFDNYRHIHATRRVVSAISAHTGNPVWGLITNNDDPNIVYFGWALNHMHGQVSWLALNPKWNMDRYLQWPDQMQGRYARSLADAAILFSISLRDTMAEDPIGGDMHGYSQCLSDAHVLHDFVLDDDLTSERLRSYKALILASVEPMSDAQVEAVRRYVAEGGTLLVSGYAGTTDENYRAAAPDRWGDLLGVEEDPKTAPAAGPHRIRWNADGDIATFDRPLRRVRVRPGTEAAVLAETVNDGRTPSLPAIVETRHGKGRCIYVAPQLGRGVYQPGYHCGREWGYEGNPPLMDLLRKAAQRAVGETPLLKALQIPEKVLVTAYRYEPKEGERRVLIHFLNATGATDFQKGDVVPMLKEGVAFPPLAEDLIFDLRINAPAAKARFVSPDYAGERAVRMESVGDALRITVPKDNLRACGMVDLTLP